MKISLKHHIGKCFVVAALLLASTMAYARNNTLNVPLSIVEEDSLILMREEEKLARDVYNELFSIWGLPVFKNIASSEQTHMNAIKTLLDRYGIEDPAANYGAGKFSDPDLQSLYDALISRGAGSLVEALNVGVDIEKQDIVDLNAGIAISNHNDIIKVYTNLLNGSYNHLAAFGNNLTLQ